jgi:uncharacterized repeat protein (TIGR03843 family)
MSDPVRHGREPTPEAASALALEARPRAVLDLLRNGALELLGRLSMASNASFYAALRGPDPKGGPAPVTVACVYKPIRGERPLDDFPDGTLAFREVAAFVVSEAAGWRIVPPTVLRDGPFGLGMVQLWLDPDEGIDPVALIRAGAPALRRMALFDALVNNADRKVGHLLPMSGGHVYGVDHGICFAVEPKLRTVLWGWRGQPFSKAELSALRRLEVALGARLGRELRELLAPAEVRATAGRTASLLAEGCFPQPDRDRPVIPWPPY